MQFIIDFWPRKYMKVILNAGQRIKHCDIKVIKEQVPEEAGVP